MLNARQELFSKTSVCGKYWTAGRIFVANQKHRESKYFQLLLDKQMYDALYFCAIHVGGSPSVLGQRGRGGDEPAVHGSGGWPSGQDYLREIIK